MEIGTLTIGAGGITLASAAGLLRLIKKKRNEPRTNIDAAVAGMKLAIETCAQGIESMRAAMSTMEVIIADIPKIKARVGELEIRAGALRESAVRHDLEISDIRREAENLQDRVSRLEHKQREQR